MTIDLTQLIFRKKNAFSKDECQFLIEEYDKLKDDILLESCLHAVTGEDTVSTFLRTEVKYGTEAWDLVFKANENLINEYMDYLDDFGMFHVGIRETMLYSHMYRLLKYEPGSKIHPHIDHATHVYGSATFNLNDDYTGGDFVFWNGKHRVKLEAGEGMIWPADFFWVHEVEPVETGVRYSTNSFLLNLPEPIIRHFDMHEKLAVEHPDCQRYIEDQGYKIKPNKRL